MPEKSAHDANHEVNTARTVVLHVQHAYRVYRKPNVRFCVRNEMMEAILTVRCAGEGSPHAVRSGHVQPGGGVQVPPSNIQPPPVVVCEKRDVSDASPHNFESKPEHNCMRAVKVPMANRWSNCSMKL